jgi:hypothetical protein
LRRVADLRGALFAFALATLWLAYQRWRTAFALQPSARAVILASGDSAERLMSDEVVELPISADDAAKLIMSAGLIQPKGQAGLAAMAEAAKLAKPQPQMESQA